MTHTRLNVIDRHHVDSLLAKFNNLLFVFHREAQQRQQSYISWMKTLTVREPDCESVLCAGRQLLKCLFSEWSSDRSGLC